MARRSQHSFLKRQKELERKQRAEEKRARKHGKRKPEEPEEPVAAEQESAPQPEEKE